MFSATYKNIDQSAQLYHVQNHSIELRSAGVVSEAQCCCRWKTECDIHHHCSETLSHSCYMCRRCGVLNKHGALRSRTVTQASRQSHKWGSQGEILPGKLRNHMINLYSGLNIKKLIHNGEQRH